MLIHYSYKILSLTLPNFYKKIKGKSEKSAKHKKNYYSAIKKYDQHTSKNYSDTESDEFLSLSEDDDEKNTDYVTTSA